MAKVTAPLLSFEGSGQIGSAQVYAKWRGIPYARRYVIPANPNSTGQKSTRSAFSLTNAMWKFAGALITAPWTAYAKGKPLTDRNAFVGVNTKLFRADADNSEFVGSPGANGGVVATSIAAADGGSQTATVTLGVPEVPSGWTITDSVAALIPAGSYTGTPPVWTPSTSGLNLDASYAANSGDDSGSVDVPAVAGDFVAVGWFVMTKADGSLAYGASKVTTVTLA